MQRFYARNPAARPRPCADAVVMASVGPFGFTAAAWSGLWPEYRAKCITRYWYTMTCRRLTIVWGVGDVEEEEGEEEVDLLTTMSEEEASNVFQNFFDV